MATFTLTEGPDTLNRIGQNAADSILALGGGDLISTGGENDTVILGEGPDTALDIGGNNSIQGNSGNDSIRATTGTGTIQGGDGADSIDVSNSFGYIVAGGNDSSDAADSITGSTFGDFLLGNGGADTIAAGGGQDTLVGGFGNDSIVASGILQDFIWGNENNDTINAGGGNNSVWGGQGNDSVIGSGFIFGNEAADTLVASGNQATTLWGGTILDGSPDGNDLLIDGTTDNVTLLGQAGNDTLILGGNSTASGGVDGDVFNAQGIFGTLAGTTRITDLNWGIDQIDLFPSSAIDVAANVGPIDAPTLAAAATAAIGAAGGPATFEAAAQFVFGGNVWVAIDQFGDDFTPETLINISGVTGTIDTGSFLT